MLILNLQFYSGDKEQAMQLARLICDLEPDRRDDVVFMFSARFDCTHDEDTINYVWKKFKHVIIHTTKRKAVGWPDGPNKVFADSYERCVEMHKKGALPGNISAVLFMEADCIPLTKDWINRLIDEYKACGKKILGAWLKKGDAGSEHINGNCIISLDFWRKFPAIFNPPSRGGWDATLAYGILREAAPSRLIWSDYRLGTTDNPWKGCEYLWGPREYGCEENALYGEVLFPVWYHGIKTDQGIACVREKLINQKSC